MYLYLTPLFRMWKHSLFTIYLERFRKFYLKHRTIPSFAVCMEVLQVNSKSVVHRFFQTMVEEWYLTKSHWIYYPWDRLVWLPLFESVRAWFPSTASDEVKDQISIEDYLVDHPTRTILLKVKWDSMVEAWLHEWDVLVVEREHTARVWDIVIGIVDNEYTVKYLEKDDTGARYLKPWNPDYENIYPHEALELFGVVTGSFRKYM